jgi:predicted component of type VI protein secretion system
MAAQFQFVMRSGPTPGATFSLEGDQLTIGRDSSSAVAINDAEISRKHARMTFQGGKYVIEDLGSTNGTFVNGQRLVSAVVLKSGDVVSFGEQIVLMYEALSSDPGETMISRKGPQKPVPAAAPAQAPAAVPAPAPQQYYTPPSAAGSVGKPKNNMPLFIGGGVVILICLCVILFVGVDQLNYWCTFPFSIIVKLVGSTCP